MSEDGLRGLDALLTVALRLARSAPSGRVALAQLARAIELEWIPQPWGAPIVAELRAAADAAAEPLEFSRVQKVLRVAWGAPPSQELDELEGEPVRVTPTAQVHRGELEGRAVAVKVQRPGLARLVGQDLALLESLAGPLRTAFPAVDAGALLREVRERVVEELDLESEAQAMRRFHRALRDHPLFVVPAPATRLATESVVVSEWIDGVSLAEAADPDGACARLVLFALGAAEWGTAHAALDPREVLSLKDGRIAILDFSSVRTAERQRLRLAQGVLESFVAQDGEGLRRAVSQLGWLPEELAGQAEELTRHALGPFAGAEPVRLDSAAVVTMRDRLLERPAQIGRLLAGGRIAPEDLWPARGLGQLFATVARTGATGPWRELVRAGLREGWNARL